MLGGKNIRFTSVRLSTRELAEQLSINGAIFSLDCETDDQAFLPTLKKGDMLPIIVISNTHICSFVKDYHVYKHC